MEGILNLFIITLNHMWQAIDRCKIPFGSTYFSLVDVLIICFLFLSFGKFLSSLFGLASEYNDFTIRHDAWKTRKFREMNRKRNANAKPLNSSNKDHNALQRYNRNRFVQQQRRDLKTMFNDVRGGK